MKKYLLLFALLLFTCRMACAQWSQVNSGTNKSLKALEFKGGIVMAGGDSGIFLKSSDFGLTWQSSIVTGGNSIGSMNFFNANSGFVSTRFNWTWKYTSNGGGSWSTPSFPYTPPSNWTPAFAALFTSPTTGLMSGGIFNTQWTDTLNGYPLGNSAYIVRVVNSVATLINPNPTALNPLMTNYPYKFFRAGTSSTYFLINQNAIIYRSTNDGVTWASAGYLANNPWYAYDLFPISSDTVVGVTYGGEIKKTNDGGLTWSIKISGTTKDLYGVAFYNSLNGYAVGDSGAILKTVDGGNTWSLEPCAVNRRLNAIKFLNATDVVIVGDSGLVLINQDGDVWPGDANHNLTANGSDLLSVGLHYGQTGPARASVSNLWQAYPATGWGAYQSNCSDVKHADCNGDGTVNASDTTAIQQNFGLTHPLRLAPAQNNLAPGLHFVSSTNTYPPNTWVDLEVWTGDASNQLTNFYGAAFNFQFASALMQNGTQSVNYIGSWAGTNGTNALGISKINWAAGQCNIAFCRTNHTNINGYGKLATIRFKTKATATSLMSFNLTFTANTMTDNNGNYSTLTTQPYTLFIDPALSVNEIEKENRLEVFPNPAKNELTVSGYLLSEGKAEIKIYDLYGRIIFTTQTTTDNYQLATNHLSKGIYFVEVTSGGNVYRARFVKE